MEGTVDRRKITDDDRMMIDDGWMVDKTRDGWMDRMMEARWVTGWMVG